MRCNRKSQGAINALQQEKELLTRCNRKRNYLFIYLLRGNVQQQKAGLYQCFLLNSLLEPPEKDLFTTWKHSATGRGIIARFFLFSLQAEPEKELFTTR
jgi:hypothetical protein